MTQEQPVGAEPSPARPRTSRKRAYLVVIAALAVCGVLVGALWAWIAPSIHAVVAVSRKGERVHEYLGSESQNFFVAPVLLAGLLGVVAVVAAVAVWQWRDHRGPHMVAALTAGLIAAAALAATVGALLVRMRYGAVDFNTVPLASGEHSLTYVELAPPVLVGHSQILIAATLISPAGIAALVYAMVATGSVRDDLGGYPPQRRQAISSIVLPPVPPAPPTPVP
ncbi:DUF2567 domain-containing protein [Mycobacterium vicinigordonae]|uniref:DUF2567 domain-containing protein n=1 Tax=Mycobacterium vicinigordonae TaxID=1719132 RepID=A0A7D6HUD3_9MYCO|nr:DUF2567 domain-containing protein [Mycobacterium vicinigordonae]QLL10191.1 DUF2567 domain-containing protein [Mycobacterium vicinigordonae]